MDANSSSNTEACIICHNEYCTCEGIFEYEIAQFSPSNDVNQKKEDLSQLLNSWNLSILLDHFIEQGIYIDQLRRIKPHQISKLVEKFPLGVYVDFEYMLTAWHQNQGIETIAPTLHSTPVSILSNSPISPDSPDTSTTLSDVQLASGSVHAESTVDLETILQNTSQGRLLLQHAKGGKELNGTNRRVLCDTVINHFIGNNITMTPSLLKCLASTIIRLFPKECEEYYYFKPGKSNPKGCLYYKFHNMKSKLRQGGLDCSRAPPKDETNLTTPKELPDTIDSAEHKRLVRFENLSQNKLLNHWKGCAKERINFINASSSTMEIFREWPQFKEPCGYKLIDSDFNLMYDDPKKIFAVEEFYKKFINVAANEVHDSSCKKIIDTLKSDYNIPDNGKYLGLFLAIHGYLVPTSKRTSKEICVRKTFTKCTIKDSQNSFIYVTPTISALDDRLQHLQVVGESIQPFVIVVGEMFNPQEVLVYFDRIQYKMSSIISAVDICFKIFYVFNLNYPLACEAVWQFIQNYFFCIKTKKDKPYPKIELLTHIINN